MNTLGGAQTCVRSTLLAGAAAIMLVAGCCDLAGVAPERRAIAKAAGDNQVAAVGEPLDVAPSVRVTNLLGRGVAGLTVTFAIVGGGGSLSGVTQTTDANGFATVGAWVLGSRPGSNSLTATADGGDVTGNPVTFTATARAGAPAMLVRLAGDGQSATVGQQLAVAPAVGLSDRFGNAVAGVPVSFAVTGGGGQVTGAQTVTDASGAAAVGGWTLGTIAGPNALTATAAGANITGNPATFTASANPGPAARITPQAGDGQEAQVGQPLPIAPTVLVRDQFGNSVPGVSVTFAVATGGGSITGPNQTTNAAGQAAASAWTLGTTAGVNRLTATAAGTDITGNPVTFTATALAAAPASIAAAAGDNQQATVGEAVAIPPAVLIRDRFGNAVAGVPVTFAVAGGGGSLTGPNQTSGPDGIATVGSWLLGPNPGANTLNATAAGSGIQGNPVTFSAIAVSRSHSGVEPARRSP